jgi:hypothetical protein
MSKLEIIAELPELSAQDRAEIQGRLWLAAKFDELGALKDGWHDGGGVALDRDRLSFVAASMVRHFPEKLALPAIVPTPDGNVLLEWNAPGTPSVDLDLGDLAADFHTFGAEGVEVERAFNLATKEAWPAFFTFLSRYIDQRPE